MNPKKCLALLLALLCMLPAFSLSEEAPAYQPGDTVELKFAVTENPNKAVAATARLVYDHDAFALIPSDFVQNDMPFLSTNLKGIPVGETVEAAFRVLPGAAAGVYSFRIEVEQAGDINETEVSGLAFSSFQVTVEDLGALLSRAEEENAALRAQLNEAAAQMDALSLQISDYAQMLAQASSENETLRRQLEEAQKALEEEKARADAEKAEFQAQVDAQKKQQQPSPSPESDFNYEIRNGKATITKYTGKGGDVVIPDTLGGYPVSIVGDKAFYKCDSLTNVTIPDSVKSIGVNAFYGCGSLTSVTIPSSVTSIGGSAFYGCSSLKSITIPSSVTSIGSYTFYECLGLTSVTIPDSVTSIGVNAFSSCNKSLIIYISKGSYAESYCKRWKLNYKLQ